MTITHATPADGTFSVAGEAAWEEDHAVDDNTLVAAKLSASATDKLFGRLTAGAGAGEEIACTAAGRALLDDADANAQLTTLGGAAYTGTGGVVRATSPVLVTPSGNTITATTKFLAPVGPGPQFSFTVDTDTGIGSYYGSNDLFVYSSGVPVALFENGIGGIGVNRIQFSQGGTTAPYLSGLDGANILAQLNTTNAQKFRVYGTTTGSKYAQLEHDGTNAILSTTAGYIGLAQRAVMYAALCLKGYTVATLPAGTAGDSAYVTDALAPAFLAAVAGGGAAYTPVSYDGAAWVCG